MMTLFGFVIGVLVLHKLFKQDVEGLLRMAETLRLMLAPTATSGSRRRAAGGAATGAAPPTIWPSSAMPLMDDVDSQIAGPGVGRGKNRLAALMSDWRRLSSCAISTAASCSTTTGRACSSRPWPGPTSVAGRGADRPWAVDFLDSRKTRSHAQEVIDQRLAARQTPIRLSPPPRAAAGCCASRWCRPRCLGSRPRGR